jgi:hypothetical protein
MLKPATIKVFDTKKYTACAAAATLPAGNKSLQPKLSRNGNKGE